MNYSQNSQPTWSKAPKISTRWYSKQSVAWHVALYVSSNGLVLISINYGCHGIPWLPRVLFFQVLELSIYLRSPKSFKEIRNQRWLTIPRRWASKLVRPRAKLRSAYEFFFCFFLFIYECSWYFSSNTL
jgi:hypothetical protein